MASIRAELPLQPDLVLVRYGYALVLEAAGYELCRVSQRWEVGVERAHVFQ